MTRKKALQGSHDHYLNQLWQTRIHVDPAALASLPLSKQGQFETVWGLAQIMLEMLKPLPAGFVRWWLAQTGGHIIIHPGQSEYTPGLQEWRNTPFTGVAYISATDAACNDAASFLIIMRLLDHLLGSRALGAGADFSAGYGATPGLSEAARRYTGIAQLEYGYEELAAHTESEYLGITMWTALHSPMKLSRIDPLLARLYQQTLLAESFWQRQV